MWFDNAIVTRLLDDVTSTAQGCTFFLAQAAEAEAVGEALVFGRLAEHAPERQRKLITRHHDDERVHAQQLRDAALACSDAWPRLSPDLNMVRVLDRELGGPILSGPIRTDAAAIQIYLIMHLLEQRAAHEIGLLARSLTRAGRIEGKLLARISADEHRHIRYCRAALKLYGHPVARDGKPSSDIERELRAEVRRAFDFYDHDTLAHLLETGLLCAKGGRLERAAWRALLAGLALKTRGRRHRGTTPLPTHAT